MNKTKAVQLHLIEKGSITSWEAIQQYGATRLSAIIFNLRARGMDIESERIDFTDRFGSPAHYAKYVFKGDNNADNK